MLILVLLILTFSILLLCKCKDDFHLGVATEEEYHAPNQHEDFLTFVVEDISIIIVLVFLHKSRPSTNLPCSMHEHAA